MKHAEIIFVHRVAVPMRQHDLHGDKRHESIQVEHLTHPREPLI